MLKVNNRNTRTRREICSKLTIKTPESRLWRPSGVFIVNFEQVNADWDEILFDYLDFAGFIDALGVGRLADFRMILIWFFTEKYSILLIHTRSVLDS